jgi:hypothetical protein
MEATRNQDDEPLDVLLDRITPYNKHEELKPMIQSATKYGK